jgi:hypothetical protein
MKNYKKKLHNTHNKITSIIKKIKNKYNNIKTELESKIKGKKKISK